MFGIMGTSAAFAQAAGAKKALNELRFVGSTADPVIFELSCSGDITIESIKNGAPVTATYSDITDTQVSIQADANTEVVIKGDVTKIAITDDAWAALTSIDLQKCLSLTWLNVGGNEGLTELDLSHNTVLQYLNLNSTLIPAIDLSHNTELTILDCSGNDSLTDLDLSANTALTMLNCGGCQVLTALDVSKNTALTELNCNSCYALTTLDVSKNTALTTLYCSACAKLVSISYPATNEDVATAIAGAITDAASADGTVYTDSQGAYYSTIADAATAKGWTIEQIAA